MHGALEETTVETGDAEPRCGVAAAIFERVVVAIHVAQKNTRAAVLDDPGLTRSELGRVDDECDHRGAP